MDSANTSTIESTVALGIDKLENIQNLNVRRVVLSAMESKERNVRDSSYELHGTYSEAYQGEQA